MELDYAAWAGPLYVGATLLPLASFALILLGGTLRAAVRPYRESEWGGALFQALGGDIPRKTAAYLATGAIALAFVLSLIGFILFARQFGLSHHEPPPGHEVHYGHAWFGQTTWATLSFGGRPATQLTLGYYIDSLSAIMFLMVTFVATWIHVFSIGYMSEELQPEVEDHQVHTDNGHLRRRGRFGRFFLYLSLFCFSMLNLVLADNLFQVFVSWELVGLCSYLLIGFYYERRSASNAAIKAFVTNRIGDAGFIIGLLILWAYVGTFNFQDLFQQLPLRQQDGSLTGWLLAVAGLGIFLGCVGKSAQFPLHVWLPDAMEGPTPVSALIHAATMVAAGVYLVGRVYPLFTLDVRLVIAYTGAITLFMAATIAVVMTDIKKVLAYSTVSQLGYMMLSLGVGGWVAGLFHLLTHAFFKALLFLGSGSVIYGCHHEQDMMKMGGLRNKMKVTAWTMAIGVLAIAGIPLFSGWYSKDQILARALGFVLVPENRGHFLLFLLPVVTVGITAFYMVRMWLLTFAGQPRDEHVYEHAHEPPRTITVPLIVLAVCSIFVAWGLPPWQAEESFLGGHAGILEMSEPTAVLQDLGLAQTAVHDAAHEWHGFVGLLAVAVGAVGIVFAYLLYYFRVLDPEEARLQFPAVHRFLWNKWYFDEVYSAILVRPAFTIAGWCKAIDIRAIDGAIDGLGRFVVRLSKWDGIFDLGVIDGIANLIARVCYDIGAWARRAQTGYIRSYVLFLVLAAIAIFFVMTAFLSAPAAGP
jgi:NADH-quinone oxidoreductase subunit L